MFYPTAGQEGSFGRVVSPSTVCLSTLTTLPVSVPSPPSSLNHFHDCHPSMWSVADMALSTAVPTSTSSKSKKPPTFRSTKGASKQRRDLINTEIKHLRDLLPLSDSVKGRLSYLHVMSLACVYTRKCNFFSQEMRRQLNPAPETADKTKMQFDFTPVVNGFLMVINSEGGLLYISENVTEYLGHSMVDLLTQGGSMFDVIDQRDHGAVRDQLKYYDHTNVQRSFFCRMNTSRPMRRQDNCSDNKVVHITGCYHSTAATSSWSRLPVFIGVCSPISSNICRASNTENAFIDTMTFTSHHGIDMKLQDISPSVVYHLGYTAEELYATSWYNLLYGEDDLIGRNHHHYLIQQVQQGHQSSCEFVVTMLTKNKDNINVFIHATSRPDMADTSPIVCENRVISDTEMQYYKAIQQNMVIDAMMPGNHYLLPTSLPLQSSEDMWPAVSSDDVELDPYYPVSNEDEMTDNQSQFLNLASPQQPSPLSPKENVYTALKEATMELVKRRLNERRRKRLNSEQSCLEPARKTCCFDHNFDDKYDVKFSAYSLPVMNVIGQDARTSTYSPQSGTDVTTHNNREQIPDMNTWAESPPMLPETPITPLSQREGIGSNLDILCHYRLPHVPDNNINLKQEICIPESILTPDPSPNLKIKEGRRSRFNFNADEEKTLSEDDLNTLRELASNLLTLTSDTDVKDITKKTTNTVIEPRQYTLIEKDHCVPSVDGTNESSPLADNSFYATSPIHSIASAVEDVAQQSTLLGYKAAAGQHTLDLYSIERLQLNLSHDQESSSTSPPSSSSSIRSEPCFSDASSFIDELESIDMEITSSPSFTTPSHGDLGFCELDINAPINSFH